MATTGKAKFDKHFAGRQIETRIRRGFGQVKCYGDRLSRKSVIALLDEGAPITVLPMDEYNPKYMVVYGATIGYVSEQFISKPKKDKGATELLDIKASDLAMKGNQGSLSFEDSLTQVLSFHSRNDITDSVIHCLKNNINVCGEAVDDMEHVFSVLPRQFIWNAAIDRHEIDELGKYSGELLFGAVVLHNKTFDGHEIVGFSVPDRSNNNGIDSYLHVKGGKIIGISSKYGTGARASFFRNILDKVQPVYNLLEPCVLTRLCGHYRDHTREAIYNYAIIEILGLKIEQPYRIYEAIRTGKFEPLAKEITEVMVAIQAKLMADTPDSSTKLAIRDRIYNNLPYSMTNYFCRLIASELNACPVSMRLIKEVLDGSPIYQVHLDQARWMRGEIRFDAYHVKSADVRIVGSKSAIYDFACQQGLLNYELKTDPLEKFQVLAGAAS